MPFPLAKLLSLGFKQASKYVGEVAKRQAKENKRFRKVLIKAAGWYHVIQTKSRLSVLGMGKVKKVQPLSEEAAIDLGVNIVGDVAMVLCALGIYFIFEKTGSRHKEHEDALRASEIRMLKEAVVYQSAELEKQAEKLKDIEGLLGRATIYSKTSERVIAELREDEKKHAKT